MAIDTIIEGVFSVVSEVFSHSLGPVFRWTGWCALRVITLGTYPPRARPGVSEAPYYSRLFVGFVGFSIWFAAGVLLISTWG